MLSKNNGIGEFLNFKLTKHKLMENPRIEVVKNGPLRVFAPKMDVSHNEETNEKEERVSFCRCGKSLKQPYCDGAHKTIEPFES